MESDYFKRVSQLTPTKFWINNVTREEARMAIEAGAMGCTQNPSYSWKMLTHPSESGYAHWPEIGFIGGGVGGLHHFTVMVGADVCITMNWQGQTEEYWRRFRSSLGLIRSMVLRWKNMENSELLSIFATCS